MFAVLLFSAPFVASYFVEGFNWKPIVVLLALSLFSGYQFTVLSSLHTIFKDEYGGSDAEVRFHNSAAHYAQVITNV